jgi:hypothetical protein
VHPENTATFGCDGNSGGTTFMHANAGSTKAAFHHNHFRFHRRISAGENERRVYESDKEGVENL